MPGRLQRYPRKGQSRFTSSWICVTQVKRLTILQLRHLGQDLSNIRAHWPTLHIVRPLKSLIQWAGSAQGHRPLRAGQRRSAGDVQSASHGKARGAFGAHCCVSAYDRCPPAREKYIVCRRGDFNTQGV